jgi:hypothetical protein
MAALNEEQATITPQNRELLPKPETTALLWPRSSAELARFVDVLNVTK